jgi:hypothetical protein
MLSTTLCSRLVPKLGQEPSKDAGFRTWLEQGDYVPDRPTTKGTIVLKRVRLDEIVRFLSFDFERFSLSCRESYFVMGLEKNAHNLTSWPLLKSYYASFFGAHAILRGQGAGVSQLVYKQISRLNEIMQIHHSGVDELASGTYGIRIDENEAIAGEVNVSLQAIPRSSGVHEGFWIYFSDYLVSEAEKAVKSGAPDSTQFLIDTNNLFSAIRTGNKKSDSWLSNVRNEINYQHGHETWFPTKKSAESVKAMAAGVLPSLTTAHLNTSREKTPMLAFLNTTIYITSLSIAVGDFVAARSSAGGAFGQKWRRMGSILAKAV